MINGEYYFVFHAPRQSGKTTFFDALTNKTNSNNSFYAINCSLATLQNVTDENIAMSRVISQLNIAMRSSQVKSIKRKAYSFNSLPGMDAPDSKVLIILNHLCLALDRDLVVIFDEVDCLSGPALLTFLSQIRDGYNLRHRPNNKFPSSLALVGRSNIIKNFTSQNYSEEQSDALASSFNILADSMTLANFTHSEIKTLYHQHTEATGQVFEDEAIERVWYWSEGQPWLVNALAWQVIEKELENDYSVAISEQLIDQAADGLFKRQDAHLGTLLTRLKEPRVIKVMQPVFAGTQSLASSVTDDDVQYCKDLGLVVSDDLEQLRPANPIYRQAMARYISIDLQKIFPVIPQGMWIKDDRLLVNKLLDEYRLIWQEYSASLAKQFKDNLAVKYDEATHVFMLYAFLLRSSTGHNIRWEMKYAEGRGSVDICGIYNGVEYPIEVKVKNAHGAFEKAK
ncbi:MAG: AAA-like domain-containing protein [Deltaproteobacteria bacterium]|nr:AAA-like domain-containing protein [Deltaproteobacteria bacterium]